MKTMQRTFYVLGAVALLSLSFCLMSSTITVTPEEQPTVAWMMGTSFAIAVICAVLMVIVRCKKPPPGRG